MPKSSDIRFEATDIDADVSGDVALLMIETADSQRVVIHMHRSVFDALSLRIQSAQEQATVPSEKE